MKLNTRLHSRIRFKTWVKVIPQQGPGLLSNIEDISTSGLGIEHDRVIQTEVDCHVYFMLPLNGRENIVQARCRIASCRPAELAGRFHIGLAFLDFVSEPRSTAELIESFIRHVEQTAG
ncbi:PilZ domain-containing protein [Chitinimonas arctica]|uniref:PilZ domain-containing protein n=1 Tax=Chitinimonas arctica TaxID=2594795 RepID=A0A516SGM7_9NEIS|nr:PilZ domain-containing protein [Chitinimonas arctica]QDQ27282.1 PilZ domain-containing protein [Chitinimonas arctica]